MHCHSHHERKQRIFGRIVFFVVGFAAFLWVLLRTGSNPKRIGYPCQKAAAGIAAPWVASVAAFFGAGTLAKLMSVRKYRYISVSLFALCVLGGTAFVARAYVRAPTVYPKQVELAQERCPLHLPRWTVPHPISDVFVVSNVPPTVGSVAAGDASVPDRNLQDPGMDSLLMKLHANGIPLQRTPWTPQGLVGDDSVVVIKCNFQWEGRSGTNTDRVKGLINRIVQSPGRRFHGEVLVVDNTQAPVDLPIGQDDNNSDDRNQSIIDVVNTFKAKGYPVSVSNWGFLNPTTVEEYSNGDPNDGYVYRPDENKITYPKFKTPGGRLLSMRYGVWSPETRRYDRSKMTLINMPILKAHISAGATEGIKNWVGLFGYDSSTVKERYGIGNEMHEIYFFGSGHLIPALIDKVRPDLTIIDASWINAMNHNERDDYSTFGRFHFDPNYLKHTKVMVASKDPMAASWYATKYILTPLAYTPERTNPDLPESEWDVIVDEYYGESYPYAKVLASWQKYFAANGVPWTRDPQQISVY